MNMQKTLSVLMLAALVLAGAAMIAIRNVDRSMTTTVQATVLPEPMPLADFQLIDQDGKPFNRESLRGRPSLLFFGFTHCPDICPATLQQLAVARGKLALQQGREGPLPDIILISVDPERDSAEILKAYTGHFGEGVTGLGGDPVELKKLASSLGIFYARDDSGGDNYTMSHSTAVLLLNADAELQALFNAPLDIDALVADLSLLMDSG